MGVLLLSLLAVAASPVRVAASLCESEFAAALPQRGAGMVASLGFSDGAWQLELRREGGAKLLHRSFTSPREDCPLAAQTAALMVDRFVRALGSGAVELAPRPRAQRRAALAGPATAESPVAQAPPQLPAFESGERHVILPEIAHEAPAPAEVPRDWSFAVSAGAAGRVGGDELRPGVWLDVTAHTAGWNFSLSLAAASHEVEQEWRLYLVEERVPESAVLALSAKPCFDFGLHVCAGPFVGARALAGRTPREKFTLVHPEVGAALELAVTLPHGFSLSASALAGVAFGKVPDGVTATAPSGLDLTTALTLGYQIY